MAGRRSTTTHARRRYVPWQFNPPPRFGLRLPRCPRCTREMFQDRNPIIHIGGGVLVKFGICDLCMLDEMHERESMDLYFQEISVRELAAFEVAV